MQLLAGAMPKIYSTLLRLSENDLEAAKHLLAEEPCIWTGQGFVPVNKTALRFACPVEALPAESQVCGCTDCSPSAALDTGACTARLRQPAAAAPAHLLIDSAQCRGPLNLAPWLVVIPGELNPFQDLLEALGVPLAFSGAQYAAVLADMAAQHGAAPLPAVTLEQAISIVQVRLRSCQLSSRAPPHHA